MFFRDPIGVADSTGSGALFGPQDPTETVCTEPVPVPSSGIRSSGWEAPEKPPPGGCTPTSLVATASSEVMLSPGAPTPTSLAGATMVMRPVCGAYALPTAAGLGVPATKSPRKLPLPSGLTWYDSKRGAPVALVTMRTA